MKITLVNPYELGRQPFGLAEPAAFLQRAGVEVRCCDLSIQKLDTCLTPDTGAVAIYIAMHTATRIAIEALPKIKELAPDASLCVYGLYAPMNAYLFRSLGVLTILGQTGDLTGYYSDAGNKVFQNIDTLISNSRFGNFQGKPSRFQP